MRRTKLSVVAISSLLLFGGLPVFALEPHAHGTAMSVGVSPSDPESVCPPRNRILLDHICIPMPDPERPGFLQTSNEPQPASVEGVCPPGDRILLDHICIPTEASQPQEGNR
jgi:hypothetical protein